GLQCDGSPDLCWAVSFGAKYHQGADDCEAGYRIRWHRTGFRSYWRWKSRHRCGRPIAPLEIRKLIREMSIANPLWGAPRIHGELLKLGIDIGQTSVAKYMVKRRGPPSQGWKTFLHNHADGIAAIVRRAEDLVSPALWIADHGARPTTNFVVWRHS